MMTVLFFLLAIAILVFVHEMGHYLAARQCGVAVERFSIGFGRALLKWRSKRSNTEWVIAAIPLGGYVKMDEPNFEAKPLAARAWIVFAGPLSNLVFAALAYAFLFHSGREEPIAVLAQPEAQSVAALAGLREGDRVIGIGVHDVLSFNDMRWRIAQAHVGEGAASISVRVERPSGELIAVVLPLTASQGVDSAEASDPSITVAALGFAPLSKSVRVIRVQEGSVAQAAGLRDGDRILRVGQEEVRQPGIVISRIKESQGKPIELTVSDGSQTERVVMTARAGQDGVFRIGAVVGAEMETTHVADAPLQALVKGATRTWEMSLLTVRALGRMVAGELSWRQISGPVTIADAAGQSAGNGVKAFVGFLALISISIAVLNLLPIPMLDGGHLMYYLWELVRGQPLSAEIQETGRRIGVALIMALTAVALFNDFARLAGW
ncbi:MAG: RIP metalloprotease RseP [Betaproteobacteria bacterium]|jgi:regulator of sigma E protease|nr:RIP metalloprotease RseP [Betaproteobacteria bacterium]